MASSQHASPPGRAAARLDGERSRTRILDAAERLLAERGYSGTGISAISRESGLPASSIYWFFSNKDDLTAAVVERAADRWLDALEEGHDAGEDSGVRGFFRRALEQAGSRLPDFGRLLVLLSLERGESDPALRERLARVRDRARDRVSAAIATSLAARGLLDGGVAQELSYLAMSLAEGALIGHHMDPDGIALVRLAEDLEVAVLAIAELRRGEKTRQTPEKGS